MKPIPVSAPSLTGREAEYVNDCLSSSWISSNGKYLNLFEESFASYCGTKYAVACCNGTCALHLALLALGVKPGDEVIVPSLTFIATANAVSYCGATPVFADSETSTWNLDPDELARLISPRTVGIIPVHLYGQPANMDAISEFAAEHGLFVVEDAAEAQGADLREQKVGSMGIIGSFSFFGNKILSTGEGGMCVTDDDELVRKLRLYKGQGQDPERRYWFPIIGYNYRMTNIAAAIGYAQMERVDWHTSRRKEVAGWYKSRLQDNPLFTLQGTLADTSHAYWSVGILVEPSLRNERDRFMQLLAEQGIETRPFFYPMHEVPAYESEIQLPRASDIAARGISLPTFAGLAEEEVDYVCHALNSTHQMIAGN